MSIRRSEFVVFFRAQFGWRIIKKAYSLSRGHFPNMKRGVKPRIVNLVVLIKLLFLDCSGAWFLFDSIPPIYS